VTVHFIEQWLHVSPDGGNGGIELLYLVLISAVVVALVRYRRRVRAVLDRRRDR
jgi:hypothetical protein